MIDLTLKFTYRYGAQQNSGRCSALLADFVLIISLVDVSF